ncbi:MAG: T9SS type A sorting domain-containing protein [Ignavibacteriaceae bacterium]|nr:T9SS type A sorting domain-containing protein [Ignavibacteriaceae bacterium]
MFRKSLILVLFVLMLGSLSAQSFLTKLNPFPNQQSSPDTVKILAVMVNFQEDKDDATFGNGKFGTIYSKNYGTSIIDPLPHDRSYFESHFLFVKNYFNKVSKGKLFISYTVLPDTFSVSKTMRNYSPPSSSSDFTPLGEFASEVWSKADQLYPGFNFSDYNLFTILHAGVGRDISLPGSLGNERDLPSLYLSTKALQKIYGESFQGFSVSGGNFHINNSIIIPETESRELSSLGSTLLFEISINGLLAASVASHLGLPDLFDTKTGLSAIGRFGLMDGQSIFAYNGIFPPEPSAWEKIYLGWEEPVEIQSLPGLFNLFVTANSAASATDETIFKIPINSSEYFLLENRIRDTKSDGAKITYIVNGQTFTKTFLKDTTGFQSYAIDSVDGVITDVDEFDWALPGNGIVIWHIDENVINDKILQNEINADKDHRGVDVEEADGIQDIGEQFTTIFGDVVIGEGSFEDFWYNGNPAVLYENKFTKDSRPSTNSNSGANSLISITDFSEISNRMTVKLAFGDSIIKKIFARKTDLPNTENIKLTQLSAVDKFCVISNGDLYLYNLGGVFEKSITNFTAFKPLVISLSNQHYVLGATGSKLNLYNFNSDTLNSIISTELPNNEEVSSSPIFSGNQIIVPVKSGKLFQYILTDSLRYSAAIITPATDKIVKAVFDSSGSFYNFITGSKYYENGNEILAVDDMKDLVVSRNSAGEYISTILVGTNRLYSFNSKKGLLSDLIFSSEDTIHSLSTGDLRNDGNNYLVFASGLKVQAINNLGASAENFPFSDPLEIGFIGTPLIADFFGDSKAEVIAYTKDGRIFAIDGGTGKVVDGFPISIGDELSSVPVLFLFDGKLSIAAISKKNNFAAWQIGVNTGKQYWSQENGNGYNQSFVDAASTTNTVNQFFPVNRAYNYPNPVYEGTTFIRYYVNEDSKINIKIFDLAGDFVAELNDNAYGGFDNETKWDVGNIQSGIYLARVEAVSASGKTESKVIKIAVIK